MNKNMTEQKTSSPNPSPLSSSSPTTSKYPLIPNHHHPPNDHGPHRCNPSSPNATCRTTSTLGSLSAFFGVMQPDNRMSPTPFSEIRDLFRNNPRSETSRAITVKETEEPGTDRIRGTTGEPTIYSWKLKHHNCIGCRIFSYLCREFFEGIAG